MSEGPQDPATPAVQLAEEGQEAKEGTGNARVWGYVIYVACCGLAAMGIVATAWAIASALAHNSANISWAGIGIMAAIIVGIWAAGRAALYFLSAR
jgi:hypothetical protein